jgi:hypothetical protein
MKISQAKNAVQALVKFNLDANSKELHLIPMLHSAPGLGKSAIVKQVAEDLDIECRTVIFAQFDSGELGGFPVLSEDRKQYNRAKPFFMAFEKDSKGILFLDELPQSPISNQNIAAQLVNDGRIGEHKLPKGWTVVCAGNPMAARAGTNAMPSHLKDRLTHFDIEPDTEAFLDYAFNRDFTPEVTGFLLHRPEYLSMFDPNVNVSPSPRSWERANTIVGLGLPADLEMTTLAGQVGNAASADFIGFIKIMRELPDPIKSLAHPLEAMIPEKPAVLYAFCSAIAAYVTETSAKNFTTLIDRIDKKEFSAMAVRTAIKRKPELVKSKALSEWLLSTGKELLL